MNCRLTSLCLIAALALTLVACGDDSDDEAATADIDETTTTLSASDAQAEYCAIEAQIDALFEEAFSGAGTPEAIAEVMNQVVDDFSDDALAAAPEEIYAEVTVLVAATEEAANGNLAALDTPDVQAAGSTVDDFCTVSS